MAMDLEHLQRASIRLSDVIADPERWGDLLEEIARATGGMGAGLLPHGRMEGSMASATLKDCLATYVREGWHDETRDTRKRAMELLLRGEVVLDRDLVAPDEIGRSPFFDEFLPRFDGKWWAGVGFRSGPGTWCLALHRSPRGRPFAPTEKAILQQFSRRLTEIGNLSYVVGGITLSQVASAFDHIGQAVVAIDDTGKVIRTNAAAEDMFDQTVRSVAGRLWFGDRRAAAEYNEFLDRLRWTPEGRALRAAPIIVRRENAAPLLLEVLPVDGAARSPFLHARALLLLKEIGPSAKSDWQVLSSAFGLTPAEARLAIHMANGGSLNSAAEALRITKETARSRLKSIFRKTDVHRQAELVVLLTSLLRSR